MHVFITRRSFLKAFGLSAAAAVLSGCSSGHRTRGTRTRSGDSAASTPSDSLFSSGSGAAASSDSEMIPKDNWDHLFPPESVRFYFGDVTYDVYLDTTDPDPNKRPRILVIYGTGEMGDISRYEPAPYYTEFGGLITHLIVREGVTRIGKSAFSGFGQLRSVSLPESLTTIADEAFYHCQSLTDLAIPESVTTIGHWAFLGSPLSEVTISRECTFTDDSHDSSTDYREAFPDDSTAIHYY